MLPSGFMPPLAIQQLHQYNHRLFDLNKQAVYVQSKVLETLKIRSLKNKKVPELLLRL